MNFGQQALQILKAVAPTVATAVGGPFGPLAGAILSGVLGTTSEKATDAALAAGAPETLLKLKQAEQQMQTRMTELGIQEEQLVYTDIANARAREMTVRDWIPGLLAILITAGFFGTLGYMLVNGKPLQGGDALLVMLGSLGTAWSGIVAYYFGSSLGSDRKSGILDRLVNGPNANGK